MSSIVTNEVRVGRFTSSEVHCLIPYGSRPMTKDELEEFQKLNPTSKKRNCNDGFQKSGMTYIRKKYFERKLKRSLDNGRTGKDAYWGLFLETFVYSKFTHIAYDLLSNVTHQNPNLSCHAGSTDLLIPKVKVGDVKCYQPLQFCEMAEILLQQDVEVFKNERPKEYYQLVSNAVIHGVPNAESIIYMPSPEDLLELREMASDYDGADQWKYRFIYESEDYELAYNPSDSDYDSLISFEFEVPQEDKDFLVSRLEEAEEVLLSHYK